MGKDKGEGDAGAAVQKMVLGGELVKIKMVEIHEETFLKTLRKKLLWGEDKRN